MAASTLRLGTRASALARWQAEWVAVELRTRGTAVDLIPITTQGDIRSGPLGEIGGQGLFTKELQRALLDRRIDLAVHSLKDLPTEPVAGLALAAVPARESVHDVLVTHSARHFAELPVGARIGTGSPRRRAQLLHARSDLEMLDIRGNVDTRLRKLEQGDYEAIVLAEAGLKRLGFHDRITQVLPTSLMLPAVGQGALGIEVRSDDEETRATLAPLDAPPTHLAVLAERALLAALRGGCLAPVGAWGRFEGTVLRLDAVVLSADGKRRLVASAETPGSPTPEAAIDLGTRLSHELIDQGASELIASARDTGFRD